MVSEINLLPWRECKRRWERKRVLIILSAITLGVVCTIFSMHAYTFLRLSKQLQHNQKLEEEIAQFARQIQGMNKLEEEKKRLISRTMVMRHLVVTRTLLLHLFSELTRVMPDDVYLAGVKKSHDRITLAGYSVTSHSVVNLVRNLERNPLVKAPVLIEIKKNGVEKINEHHKFTVKFNLRAPKCSYMFQNE